MPHYKPSAAICWSLFVFAMASWSHAFQDAPVPPDKSRPSAKALDYAAAAALGKLMESQSYTLPEEKVRDVVLVWLRKDAHQPPKTMPAVEQLQGNLASNFEEAWTEMINKATAGLDPDGKLEVAKRLRASLENSPWQNDAKTKHDDLLKKELPKALERVKEALVQEQTKQLNDVLKNVVSPDMPGQEQVYGALPGDHAPAIKTLTDAVLGKSPEEYLEVLLVDSFEALSIAADDVVSDGVAQLQQQLDNLEAEPTAVSQPAIEKEIQSRLQKQADGQQTSRARDALHPSYGVFLRVKQAIPDKSRFRFDQQVARAGVQIVEQLALNKRQISHDDEQALQRLILAGLPAHHQPAGSWQAALPAILTMVKRRQQWLEDDLVEAFRQSKSPDDQEYPEDRFRQDIANIVNADGTLGHNSWGKLQYALLRRYEKELLPAVRGKIADMQAKEYAPLLMIQNWLPQEDLWSIPLPLQPGKLKDLEVWNNGPPQPENKVLQETWELWIKAAQDALTITRQAHDGQLQVVEELKPSIVDQIRQDAERTPDKWVKEYSRLTTQTWTTQGGKAAQKYPALFSTTVDRIGTDRGGKLPQADQEQSEKQPVEPEMDMEPRPPGTQA